MERHGNRERKALRKPSAGGDPVPDAAAGRSRMSPEDRERMILDKAVHFFAKHGFSAQTRELAREIGVSQGLIYRYFRSKEELIERVYQRNFLRRWKREWESLLQDGSLPLDRRLKRFYSEYLAVVDDYDWIRIAMHSGLGGNNLTRRYIEDQVERVLRIIALECRKARLGEPVESTAVSELEIEAVWHLHSTIIYYLIRKHILGTRTTDDADGLVSVMVDSFMSGFASPVPDKS